MAFKYIKMNFITFIALFLSIVLVVTFLNYKFFINDFIKLENKQNQNNINTILSAINTNIENIKNITNDYSKWDDSYAFMNDANQDYIYENFREGTTTLEDLDIDFIIYSTLKQKVIFSKYSNGILKKSHADFENKVLKKFQNDQDINTIFKYKTYSMYLIKSEIKKSDSKGDSNGYIYSGKIINNENINALTKVFKKIYLADEPTHKNDSTLNFSHLKNVQVKMSAIDSDLFNNIQISDSHNNYIFSIITENEREIVKNGKKTILVFNIIISIFLFIILFILYKNQSILESIVESKSKELIEKQKIIAHQSKMAAMGEMIENIAHQWRQPLSVISTASTGIIFQKEINALDDKLLLESMKNISNSTQYLSDTINDFRNFFNKNRKNVLFDLTETLEKSLSLINPILTYKDIHIIKNTQNIRVHGISNELIQVFLNIFNNSIEAFDEKTLEYDKLIVIEISEKNNYAIITIKDNAGGIPNDIIEKIFEPYFTTKHKSQGTGIGLYMSFEIINKHMEGELFVKNSSYTIEENKYKGAEFTIKLPLVKV